MPLQYVIFFFIFKANKEVMMVKGVGTDIIEISRIEKLLSQHSEKGLLRIFTDKEISYCSKKRKNAESFAGRFAAKEALFKATGIGWRDGLKWIDFEILNDDFGKPEVVLSGKAQEILAGCKIHISISHNKTQATAFVIIEEREANRVDIRDEVGMK